MVFKRISLPVCRSSPVMLGLRFCVSPKPALCGRFGFGVSWRRLSPEEKASAEGKPSETERVLRRPPTRIVATFENAKQRGGWREGVSGWKRSGYPRAGLSPLNTENRKCGFLCDLTTVGIGPAHFQFWAFLTHRVPRQNPGECGLIIGGLGGGHRTGTLGRLSSLSHRRFLTRSERAEKK
jgi:hypothetical protein